jgi:hypothetical protein
MITVKGVNMATTKKRITESRMFWQVIIDKKLHHRFKLECVRRQVSMNEEISELIREFLKGGK